jgi:hypothetical protein
MLKWKTQVGDALCWTVLAPLIRAKRRQAQRRWLAEYHDRQRIDALLSEIVARYGDLLA